MTEGKPKNPVEQILDREKSVKDLVEKYGVSEHAANVAFLVSCGDNIYDACEKVYSVHTKRQAGELMSMWKFRECLNYLSSESFIEERVSGLKLHLLYFGLDKLKRMKNENAIVGLWKTLMGLAFEDKLPDAGAGLNKKLDVLAKHFSESEKAKEQIVSNLEKVKEEDFVN